MQFCQFVSRIERKVNDMESANLERAIYRLYISDNRFALQSLASPANTLPRGS